MKRPIFSARNVEVFVGLLATVLIAAGLLNIMLLEPDRMAAAQAGQLAADLDAAQTLYAENCAVCHGLTGEGIGAMPPLDSPALREAPYDTLTKIIARGLYDTAMPAWSETDGGPLSDYQITELVSLIQFGDWSAVQDRVVNLGLAPQVPFTSEPDPQVLTALAGHPLEASLVQGIELYAAYCVACHGTDGLGSNLAPALNDPAIQARVPEDLTRTVNNGIPGTLMAGWDGRLAEAEVAALVTLMLNWDQVPDGAVPAPDRPVPVTAESLALGADLYSANCARCHGPEGQGTPRAPALNVKGFLTETNDGAIEQIITSGVPGTSMPSWGDRLDAAGIQAIVGFIRAWEPSAPEVAEPARGGGPWWSTGGTSAGQGQNGQKGPPWLRDGSTTGPSTSLPSGGLAGQTAHTPGQGQAAQTGAVSSPAVETGVPAADSSAGTPPGAGRSQASGQDAHPAGGGPPWAQTTAESPAPALDQRAVLILGSSGALALGLIGLGLFGLWRLPGEIPAPGKQPTE